MGTRATITFMDNQNEFVIYQHYDGYAKYVEDSMRLALQYAWELPRFEAGDFAAAYIRATKERGGNIYLTHSPGDHDDLAYRYNVHTRGRGLSVITYMLKEPNIWVGVRSTLIALPKESAA